MAQTIWERYFRDQYDIAVLDIPLRMARPAWLLDSFSLQCRAGYVFLWPYRCPHCGVMLVIERGGLSEREVVLVIAEERMSALPCPYCGQDIPTQQATKEIVEHWAAWRFDYIWVANHDGEKLQVEAWRT